MFRAVAICRCSLVQRAFSTTTPALAGHNKWSKIAAKKGVNDIKKSMVYGKASRDIMVAVRSGGSADPNTNAALAAVLRVAKLSGVPRINIENALKKVGGDRDKGSQLATYEAMAFGEVGIIIRYYASECLTDNPNRTIHKLRELLTGHNARFAPVKYLFTRKGLVRVSVGKPENESLETRVESAIEVALLFVDDFSQNPESGETIELEFTCQPENLGKLTSALTSQLELVHELLASELVYAPTEIMRADEHMEGKVANLVETLEGHEDTLRVYTTLDLGVD
ncbi:YebC-like protein [Thelephora ganbajun]|uniref:YebC-like protein n=1 Tax=Thelephora ganbajun TaxID=370292 RepID=A0ACB6ZUJ1_THEGA|nr:YebC-like protein [Thelephora ganbajun]